MKHEVPIRVNVVDPLKGVEMRVQRGRDELLPPSKASAKKLVFDFEITVDISSNAPNFLGKYAQGPKDARFIYVNSGTYAGQGNTCWSRRAKLSLMSIDRKQVDDTLANKGSRIEVSVMGVGRDGGPTCASVRDLVWNVIKK